MNRRMFIGAAATALALSPSAAWTEGFPSKPLKLIVPFAPGGPSDIFARALGGGMSAELRQQLVVESRAGAGGVTGMDAVAKSLPDGYTLGLAGAAALTTIPFMVSRMPFDWQRDLAPLTLVSRVPQAITVTPRLGVATLGELVAYAKANAGKLSFGSAGAGSITHLAGELFKTEAGIDIVHVPYRGAAPAVADLLGGHVDIVIADVTVFLPHVQSGAIKALAVTSAARAPALGDVPTTAEAGYAKVLSDNWYGLVAPAGTPADILKMLHAAAVAALRSDDVVRIFAAQAAVPSPTEPEEFSALVRADRAKWEPLIVATGAKLE